MNKEKLSALIKVQVNKESSLIDDHLQVVVNDALSPKLYILVFRQSLSS